MKPEEQQQLDSDTIFNLCSESFDNMDEARQAIVTFYVPDMAVSRAGISHAIKRLEAHYARS